MNVDELFKGAGFASGKYSTGGNKRKMPDNPNPEFLKKMKTDAPPAPAPPTNGSAKGKERAPAVEVIDEDDEMNGDGDFAPGGDADYFAEEDDEGRFFGGGLTGEQKEILNIFDNAGEQADDSGALALPGIRRTLLRFERAAARNQDHRSKWPDDPTKFIDSEADLDGALKALLPLAQAPALAYPELVRSGTLEVLIGLLSHENVDIAIDVVEVLHELTDEDVGEAVDEDEEEEEEEGGTTRSERALKELINALVQHSVMELLVDNMKRLNEAEESDRQGVYHILGVFENVLSSDPSLSQPLVAKTAILPWILDRIQAKAHDDNRSYAAEMLSIVLQTNRENRLFFGEKDGVESILKVLSQYRRRDPADADETEFMENLFDALCSALAEPEVKKLFLDAEGVELMNLMIKDKKQSRTLAIKTLDFALSGPAGAPACVALIEDGGLKGLFAAFMGKVAKKKHAAEAPLPQDTAHVLGILASLFTHIPSETPARIRLLAKFVESEYEKADRLLDIRDGAAARLRATEKEIGVERVELEATGEKPGKEEEETWYLRRLDGGLFTLQTVDYILAWIAMEDDGVRAHLEQMLARKSLSLRDVVGTLRVYRDNIDAEDSAARGEGEGGLSQSDILEGLIGALQTDGQGGE
ncbi:Catenin-beta-like protein [Schizophyllum amplum]|uniref:Catenin-beta-like protein n=1 Tax=Schizophyllum amplum TaxID=97359 RepID=A0A550CSP2_9AGAR|nr:Catenin-beta-like protein [Auriculariopsis ampla]